MPIIPAFGNRKRKKKQGEKSSNPINVHCPRCFELHVGFCSTKKLLWVGEDKLFVPQLLVAFVPLCWQLRPVRA